MKPLAKAVAHYLCVVLVSPALVGYWLSASLFGRNRALEGWTQAFAPLPGVIGVYLRRAFLSFVLARCHRTAEIHYGTLFSQTGAAIDDKLLGAIRRLSPERKRALATLLDVPI